MCDLVILECFLYQKSIHRHYVRYVDAQYKILTLMQSAWPKSRETNKNLGFWLIKYKIWFSEDIFESVYW